VVLVSGRWAFISIGIGIGIGISISISIDSGTRLQASNHQNAKTKTWGDEAKKLKLNVTLSVRTSNSTNVMERYCTVRANPRGRAGVSRFTDGARRIADIE
jgi:hypothetical protein